MKKKLLSLSLLIALGANAQVVNTFPYNEDFEGETQGASSCGSAFTMSSPGWSNDLTDGSQDWQADANGTSSSSTGPTANGGADHNPGIAGGMYMYVETSNTCGDDVTEVNLESPWFDLTAMSTGEMSFWYHLYGSDLASALMHVDARTGMAAAWSNDLVPAWTDNVDMWQEMIVDLNTTSLTGQDSVQFRIRFKVGPGFGSDAAIDDFSVYETTLTSGIVKIQDVNCFGADNGSLAATATYGVAPYTYAWDNGATTDTITGLAPGTYCVTVTDANGDTDNICDTIFSAPQITPYTTAIPEYVCIDSTGMIVVDSITGGVKVSGLSSFNCNGTTDSVQVGTNDVLVGGTTYPSPLGNYFWGARHQMIYRASELLAAGVQPGNLSGLAFYIDNLGSATTSLTAWTIKVATTQDAELNTFNSNAVEVYPMNNITITTGWNWYDFANSFYWNGTDNIIIETCFNNNSYTNNPNMACETTSYNATVYYRGDNSTACGNNSLSFGAPSVNRPIIMLKNCSANGYTYSWNTGDVDTLMNAIGGTSYTLTVTDGVGCQVQVNDSLATSNIDLSVTFTDEMLGNDATIDLTATGVAVPFTYDWDNDGTGDNDDTEDLTGLVAGTYAVVVTDTNGCVSSINVTVGSQVGLDDNNLSNFSIYPNPSNGTFYIQPLNVVGENVTGKVIDASGREVSTINFNGKKIVEVDLSNVQNGVYFIAITVDENTTTTKVIVE